MKFLSSDGSAMSFAQLLSGADRIQHWLNERPDGELFTTRELASRVSLSQDRITHMSSDAKLRPNVYRSPGRPLWWGSEKTIAAARKELGQ